MTWLVTGGAGYIGSHVVRAFIADGIPAVVIDDLSSGHRSFVRRRRSLLRGQHPAGRTPRSDLHRAQDQRRGPPRRLQVRRRLGEPPAAHLQPKCHRHGHPRWSRWLPTMWPTSCSPPAPRSTAHLPATWSASRIRRIRSLPYGESKLIGEWLLARPGPRYGVRPSAAAPHLAALLQRGRLGIRGSARHQPAQPLPAGLRASCRGRGAVHQRGRLPHHRTAPVSATTSMSPTSRSPTSPPPRLLRQGRPLQPVYNLGSGSGLSVRADHGCGCPRHRNRVHAGSPLAPPRGPRADRGDR